MNGINHNINHIHGNRQRLNNNNNNSKYILFILLVQLNPEPSDDEFQETLIEIIPRISDLEHGQTNFANRLTNIENGQTNLVNGQTNLVNRLTNLENGQANLERFIRTIAQSLGIPLPE